MKKAMLWKFQVPRQENPLQTQQKERYEPFCFRYISHEQLGVELYDVIFKQTQETEEAA